MDKDSKDQPQRAKLGVGQGLTKEQIKARFLSGSRGGAFTVSVKTNKVVSKTFMSAEPAKEMEVEEDIRDLIKERKADLAAIEKQSGLFKSQSPVAHVEPLLPPAPEEVRPAKRPVESPKHADIEPSPRDKGEKGLRDVERELKRLHKSNLLRLTEAAEDSIIPVRSLSSIKRAKDRARRKSTQAPTQAKVYREISISGPMQVGQLAHALSEKVATLVRQLLQLGVIAAANDVIDEDTIELVSTSLGHKILKSAPELSVQGIIGEYQDKEEDLLPRPPVVTVMGHVDHGKTSLLDALRHSNVVAGEFGGITQHISAYQIHTPGGIITVVDTPGHEAFKHMRRMGAQLTDIIVIIVAADNGVQPQTIEAIKHAQEAKLPIIVAINKIDKPGANVELTKSMLLQHGIISEDMGGDTIVVPISAKAHTNLDLLKESILLVAEMLQLKANPHALASGLVVESRMSSVVGPSSLVLVQRGKLKIGDIIIAGGSSGKVRRMLSTEGKEIEFALPSCPVEVLGLDIPPRAGDSFVVVESERKAKSILKMEERAKASESGELVRPNLSGVISQGAIKHLPLILKADAHGSVEAILDALSKKTHAEVKLRVLRAGVGEVNESDIQLASTFGGAVFAFNVGTVPQAQGAAQRANVTVKSHNVIYSLLDEVAALLNDLLDPIKKENAIGSARVLQVFENSKVGKIAGCKITKGVAKAKCKLRLYRAGKLLSEAFIKELRREKDEVKVVKEGFECGISLGQAIDVREGDVLEFFEIVEEKQKFF